MFRSFFANRRWLHWSILGSATILGVTWYKVQLDVKIYEWFGDFYDTLQVALTEPGAIEFSDFLGKCVTYAEIAGINIVVELISIYKRLKAFEDSIKRTQRMRGLPQTA
ncbi:MAG: hypothetical protein OXU19_18250 [bacterium]|nr:hypothetical protein [bacterium]